MPYRIAGIDVHKKMLAVVVADVEVDEEYRFERLKVGTSPAELRALAEGACAQDDPRIAKSRLPRRTSPSSIGQSGMIARDFRPWLIREAA